MLEGVLLLEVMNELIKDRLLSGPCAGKVDMKYAFHIFIILKITFLL